jgi:HlyD family secretion protein
MSVKSLFRRVAIIAVGVLIGLSAVLALRSRMINAPPAPILGVVHQTEIRVAPETSGRLASIRVRPGDKVHRGQVLAVLSTPELTASVEEAKVNAAAARADRANVDAGVREEEIEIAAQNLRIAQTNLVLAQQQFNRAETLAAKDVASKQQLDENTATLKKAEANLSLAQATYEQSKAGPTKEERAVAAAKVELAQATVADVEAKLAKTTLVAPDDGVVGILVAELGEAISPGQAVMTFEVAHDRWFTFTIREDRLAKISIGALITVLTAKGDLIETRITELRPLGEFAVWRATRAVGDHDLNSFLVRADPVTDTHDVEPGMTIWIDDERNTRRPTALPAF